MLLQCHQGLPVIPLVLSHQKECHLVLLSTQVVSSHWEALKVAMVPLVVVLVDTSLVEMEVPVGISLEALVVVLVAISQVDPVDTQVGLLQSVLTLHPEVVPLLHLTQQVVWDTLHHCPRPFA